MSMQIVDVKNIVDVSVVMVRCMECGRTTKHLANHTKIQCPCGNTGNLGSLKPRCVTPDPDDEQMYEVELDQNVFERLQKSPPTPNIAYGGDDNL